MLSATRLQDEGIHRPAVLRGDDDVQRVDFARRHHQRRRLADRIIGLLHDDRRGRRQPA
jgi:hypothetical protein